MTSYSPYDVVFFLCVLFRSVITVLYGCYFIKCMFSRHHTISMGRLCFRQSFFMTSYSPYDVVFFLCMLFRNVISVLYGCYFIKCMFSRHHTISMGRLIFRVRCLRTSYLLTNTNRRPLFLNDSCLFLGRQQVQKSCSDPFSRSEQLFVYIRLACYENGPGCLSFYMGLLFIYLPLSSGSWHVVRRAGLV